jgi:hypothetical protein
MSLTARNYLPAHGSFRRVSADAGAILTRRKLLLSRRSTFRVPVLRMEIVTHSDDPNCIVALTRRRLAERALSWFGRNRRLAKDFDNLAGTLVTLAAIRLATRRLTRAMS